MKKITFGVVLLCTAVCCAQGESNTVRNEILQDITDEVCACVDSISVDDQKMDVVLDKMSKCIDKFVIIYQATDRMVAVDTVAQQERTINVNVDPESAEYQKYYNTIEKILLDNCAAMKNLVSLSGYVGERSLSQNPQAMFEYNEGLQPMQAGDFKTALKHFETAVKLDSQFAFARDNIGLCYRQLKKYNKAIEAYQKSLLIDPKGEMPMVNLPVAYRMNNQNDKALEAYMQLQKSYPTNAEGYYGAGQTYLLIGQHEKALNQMCMAYILYTKQKSPYRVDAETMIGQIHQEMQKQNKTAEFYDIIKKNGINMEK